MRLRLGLAAHPLRAWVLVVIAGVAVTLGVATLIVAARRGDDPAPAAVETPAATAPATSASRTPGPSPTPRPTSTPRSVLGLFDTPRALPVASRELAPPGREVPQSLPPPTFDWDGQSTLLYDRQTGALMDLGPGEPGIFSPSAEWLVWVGPDRFTGTLHALNVRSGERKDLGVGGYPSTFVDDQWVLVDEGGREGVLVNVLNGERKPVTDRPALNLGDWLQISSPREDQPTLKRVSNFPGTRVLEFEAQSALQIGTGELLVATVPQNGLSNIFTVDFSTGSATHIATTPMTERGLAMGGNGTHIAWSDACAEPGESWVFDRQTDEFTYVPKGLFVSFAAPDGLLGTGFTGLERLIDPDTMEYVFISPAGWPHWSRDFRYVSVGLVGGHGGICGP